MGVEYRKVEKRLAFYQIKLILNYNAQRSSLNESARVFGEWIYIARLTGRIQDFQQIGKDYHDNSQNAT